MKLPNFLRKQAPRLPVVDRNDADLLRVLERAFSAETEIKTGVSINEAEFIEVLRLHEDAARRVI